MAIISTIILTTEEYLEVYPQDQSVETDVIAGSINDATITLDAICGGMIAKVWGITDPEDPLFRTEEEHNFIKQAHAIQAHEGVCRSVDFTGGSESYTSGSSNFNQSRTTPGIVADEIIYQLLAKARVYNPNITTDTQIAGNEAGDLWDPTYDPSQSYITLELGDNRYIKKHADSADWNNKFLYYDTNGNITYVDLGEIIVENIYTKEEVDELFTHYYTKIEVDTVFQTKADPNLITPTKEVVAGINEAWERAVGVQYNYAINLQDPANLPFVSTNDTITATSIKDLEGRTINVVDMVIGASIFNTDPAIPDRWLGAIDETTGQGTFYRLSEKIDLSAYQTKQDNDLETTSKYVVGAINELNNRKPMVSIIYSELKALRDSEELVAGTLYRITDYITTTTQENTQSANHPFDIIVLALNNNTLSENASAIQHSGDTYFANENLNAWELKYCLDNDTDRFEWADTTNGKGVIWFMKDEYENSMYYDFKNIQSKNTHTTDRFYYTFDNNGVDASLTENGVYKNTFGLYTKQNEGSFISSLPQNIFTGTTFINNTIGNDFRNNTIGNSQYNSIANNFYGNVIGRSFNYNQIGNYFANNTIGTSFQINEIKHVFIYNTIGNNCYENVIGNTFGYNNIGNYFYDNIVGNDFQYNSIIGNIFAYNQFGNNCYHINIGSTGTDINWSRNYFGDGVWYADFNGTDKAGVIISNGYAGTQSSHKSLTPNNNTTYYINQVKLS